MENVAHISPREEVEKIDLRTQQQKLLAAEAASINVIKSYAEAIGAYTEMFSELNGSVCNPANARILKEMQAIMNNAFETPLMMRSCHRAAERFVNSSQYDGSVELASGIRKPPFDGGG